MTLTEKRVLEETRKIAFSQDEKAADRIRAMQLLLEMEKEKTSRRENSRRERKLDAIAEMLRQKAEGN